MRFFLAGFAVTLIAVYYYLGLIHDTDTILTGYKELVDTFQQFSPTIVESTLVEVKDEY